MRLPFTKEEFLAVFARYNESVWPVQMVLVGLALLAVFALMRKWPWRDRIVSGVLALLWGWAGLVYHLGFFAAINPAAIGFGVFFLVQALLWVGYGIRGARVSFEVRFPSVRAILGGIVVAYALVIYPLIGIALGHGWPGAPTFGAPCPVVLFTFGLLFWTGPALPKVLLIVPLGWAVIATAAAFELGMYEDSALIVTGIFSAVALLLRRRSQTPPRVSEPKLFSRHPG